MSSFPTVSITLLNYIPHDPCLFIALSCPLSLIIALSLFPISIVISLCIYTLSVLVCVTESLFVSHHFQVLFLLLSCTCFCWIALLDIDLCLDWIRFWICPIKYTTAYWISLFPCVGRDRGTPSHLDPAVCIQTSLPQPLNRRGEDYLREPDW